jgi:hypothetical protein
MLVAGWIEEGLDDGTVLHVVAGRRAASEGVSTVSVVRDCEKLRLLFDGTGGNA